MTEIPAAMPFILAGWLVVLILIAVAGVAWLVAQWRRSPKGDAAPDRWNGGGS